MAATTLEALKHAKLPEKTLPICLDATAIEAYRAAEAAVQAAAADSLGGGPDRGQVSAALRDAVEAATLRLTLRAMPRGAWTDLVKDHPPRKDHAEDRRAGYNEDTFYEAMVRACIVDPVISDEDWERIDAVLTEGEWIRLATAAQALNLGKSQLPF